MLKMNGAAVLLLLFLGICVASCGDGPQIQHDVVAAPALTVAMSASDDQVAYGDSVNVKWESKSAVACSVLPSGWTGLAGNYSTGALYFTQIYSVECIGSAGDRANAAVTITVYGSLGSAGGAASGGTNSSGGTSTSGGTSGSTTSGGTSTSGGTTSGGTTSGGSTSGGTTSGGTTSGGTSGGTTSGGTSTSGGTTSGGTTSSGGPVNPNP